MTVASQNSPLAAIVASVKKIAEMDPQSEAVEATVDGLKDQISLLSEQAKSMQKDAFVQDSMKTDMEFLKEQIDNLHSAALRPALNYKRILNILAGVKRAAVASERPKYAALRPRIAQIVHKLSGVFSEVDTTEDLSKPLEQIEKAVHALYGDQSDNSVWNFDARGKGHHSKE